MPSHGVRCLSSEHAVIAKEQTAQAIANTAHAYEKSGVEAALSEVRLAEWPSFQRVWFFTPATSFLSSLLNLTSPLYFFLFFPIVLNSIPPFCCHSLRKLSLRSPRKQTLQSSQSRLQRAETQRLLLHLPLRSLRWRFPVWEGFWLDLMQMAMMRRYRDECRVAVCCFSKGVCHELMFSH